MKTILVFGTGYLNLSQLKHFLLHLCFQLKRKGGLGLIRRIGNNLSIVLQERQKTNKNILQIFTSLSKIHFRVFSNMEWYFFEIRTLKKRHTEKWRTQRIVYNKAIVDTEAPLVRGETEDICEFYKYFGLLHYKAVVCKIY